jgi:hypothetical protein
MKIISRILAGKFPEDELIILSDLILLNGKIGYTIYATQ